MIDEVLVRWDGKGLKVTEHSVLTGSSLNFIHSAIMAISALVPGSSGSGSSPSRGPVLFSWARYF